MDAFQLFDALSISFFAILGVWACVDRRHWFARFAIVGGILLSCLLVPAHELVVTFGLQVILILVGVWLAEGRKNWRPRLSLETALLAMAVVAVLAAVVARIPDFSAPTWTFHVGAGVFGAFGALVSLWIVAGSARWWMRVLGGLAGVTVFLLMMHAVEAIQYVFYKTGNGTAWATSLREYYRSGDHRAWLIAKLPSTALGWAIILSVLALGRASGWFGKRQSAEPNPASRTAIAARLAMCSILLTVAAPLAYLLYRLLTPTPLPAVELPRPNGFDDFLTASTYIPPTLSQVTGSFNAMQPALLEKLSDEVEPVAGWVTDGLEKECWAPHVFTNPNEARRDAEWMFQVGRALMARLAYLQKEQLPNRVEACLQLLRFGHECARGSGVEWPPGVYVQGHAVNEMEALLPQLDAKSCRALALRLSEIDARRDPSDRKLTRQLIIDQNEGWTAHFTQLLNAWSGNPHYENELRWLQSREVNARLLIADLALQAFGLEHGHPPDALAELVPDYLPEVPEDVFRKAPLCYRRLGDRYRVYSVGWDGDDDGGQGGQYLLRSAMRSLDVTGDVVSHGTAKPLKK